MIRNHSVLTTYLFGALLVFLILLGTELGGTLGTAISYVAGVVVAMYVGFTNKGERFIS